VVAKLDRLAATSQRGLERLPRGVEMVKLAERGAPLDEQEERQVVPLHDVVSEVNDLAPPTILAQASRLNFSTRLFNLIVTNVPGPQFPLYLLGREMERRFGCPMETDEAETRSASRCR